MHTQLKEYNEIYNKVCVISLHTHKADEEMPRFGKLGFGESCDSEVLQRRTVQIRQKTMRTSFKRRCGWSGRGLTIDPRCYWSVRFDISGER